MHSAPRIRLEYNRPVRAEKFRLMCLPDKPMLLQMWNVTKDNRTSRWLRLNGATSNEILAQTKYAVCGRIIECSSNGGDGTTFGSPRMGPYLARNFLIKLWRMKRDSTKITMTHTEIYKSRSRSRYGSLYCILRICPQLPNTISSA